MARQHEREPGLGASLNLLNLFGLDSATTRVSGASIVVLVIVYFIIRLRYPCRSPSSLTRIVDRASNLFDECHAVRAFRGGEYDRYQMTLDQITSCASEIASRIHLDESNTQEQSSSFLRDHSQRTSFLWERLKDIVMCHREAQLLIRNLEACLLRASRSHAQYQLLQRTSVPASPQPALTGPNTENPPIIDGYNVGMWIDSPV